ncbi:hypothetical protein [Legionella maceachernii]|uniref:Uncharacterized protein n=1 Tax=Legionella maceachernii TaxID=466 RepID=A0A0W0WDN1_9GAMM|nr:hypothetical protein [Legionella maceachernii]KTD30441.1 hypothetical protein Lmac_0625 [Legionella maceachernii]SJZ68984.1 hypothetical protein SAMN02745128_00788 [Legionella maceachernii]SUP02168.1 Uncharacterised protein [Legionella maceachernii]
MPVNREAPLRLFHNGEKITDATILGTYHQEGKADSSKHFVLKLHSIRIAYFIKARKSLTVLEGFSTPRSTDDLPKAQQKRLMQEASQQPNSLGCSAHTLFQPPNQHKNPMGPLAGEGRLLQQGDLLSRRWIEAYHVLEQALLTMTNSTNEASFTC